MYLRRYRDPKLALLPLVSPLAVVAGCGGEVDQNTDELIGRSQAELVGIADQGLSINWTQVGQLGSTSEIAACDSNILYALNLDFSMHRSANNGAAGSWSPIATPPNPRSIACIGSRLYALSENKDLYSTPTSGAVVWTLVGHPGGAEYLGGGHGLLYALNFDRSLWTSDLPSANQVGRLPGDDSLWRLRFPGLTNARRATGAMAHPSGQLKPANTRTFVLNADRTVSYRDDALNPSLLGAWLPLPLAGLAFSKISAGDSNVIFGLALDKGLWKGEIKETACYDQLDNDNDSFVDEKDHLFCKDLPGDGPAIVGSCNTGSVSDAFSDLCDAFPGCEPHSDCKTKQLDVFTGTVLAPTPIGSWSGYGGPGRHLGELALCLMRDFNDTSTPLAIGANSTVWQKVGRLTFNPTTRTLTGYRRLSFDVPAFGSMDTRAQKFTIKLVTLQPSPPTVSVDGTSLGLYAGNHRITEAVALSTTIDDSDQSLEVDPPEIHVPTPYGTLTFRIKYTYAAANPVVSAPYGLSYSTIADIIPGNPASLRDVKGLSVGAKYTDDVNWVSASGWASQIAGGSRVLSLWNGQGNRPEHDIGTARSSNERRSTAKVFAGAAFSMDLPNILPAALRDSAFDAHAVVTIEPYYSLDVGGDFQLYFAEKARVLVDNPWDGNAQMLIRTGFSGAASFKLRFTLDIWVDTPFFGRIVDYDYTTTQTLSSSKPSKKVRLESAAYTTNSDADNPWSYIGSVTTLNGAVIADPRAYVTSCLTSPAPVPNQLPTAEYTPGNPLDLMPDAWPCNICVWQETTTTLARGHQLVPSSPPPGWKCDSKEKAIARCQDLCSYDPVTRVTRVSSQNRRDVCFAPPPPPPPT